MPLRRQNYGYGLWYFHVTRFMFYPRFGILILSPSLGFMNTASHECSTRYILHIYIHSKIFVIYI